MDAATLSLIISAISGPASGVAVAIICILLFGYFLVKHMLPQQQAMIDDFVRKGVKTVANWYGMTEVPPPVFVGYNTESFDFKSNEYTVEFTDEGECVINGFYTGDLFDVVTKKFLTRKTIPSNIKTWKNS